MGKVTHKGEVKIHLIGKHQEKKLCGRCDNVSWDSAGSKWGKWKVFMSTVMNIQDPYEE